MNTVMISLFSVITLWTVGLLLLIAGHQQKLSLLVPGLIIMVLTATPDYQSPFL
jgi:hypothetical protein